MRKSLEERVPSELVRALKEARDYMEFSAEKFGFLDDEHYLTVRNCIHQMLKEIEAQPNGFAGARDLGPGSREGIPLGDD